MDEDGNKHGEAGEYPDQPVQRCSPIRMLSGKVRGRQNPSEQDKYHKPTGIDVDVYPENLSYLPRMLHI